MAPQPPQHPPPPGDAAAAPPAPARPPPPARLRIAALDDHGEPVAAALPLLGTNAESDTVAYGGRNGALLEGAVRREWTLDVFADRGGAGADVGVGGQLRHLGAARVPARPAAEQQTAVTPEGLVVKYTQGSRVSWADFDDDMEGRRARLSVTRVIVPRELLSE